MSEADLKAALQHPNPSTRLHAALKAGTQPHSRYPEIIVQRCAIEPDHLHDPNDEIARTAWRASTAFAPISEHEALANELTQEFGRGSLEVQRSLARALTELGAAGENAARTVAVVGDTDERIHASAVLRVFDDPEATFYLDPADAHVGS